MAQCISPIHLKNEGVDVPCGRCHPCKMRRVNEWSFRLSKEAERSCSAFFVTLTYDNDHVPISSNGFMTLDKARKIDGVYINSHTQRFFKALRHTNYNGYQIKYYMCGEYGTDSLRPHYHVILFNCPLDLLIGRDLAIQVAYGNIVLDGKQEFNCDYWPCGHITVGAVELGSIAYCLKYVCKDSTVGKHERDDRVREYSLMSKRIGDNYLSDDIKEYHLDDIFNRLYLYTEEGYKVAMPRYYKEKIYSDWQRKRIGMYFQNTDVEDYQAMNEAERAVYDEREDKIKNHYAYLQGKDDRKTSL